MPKDLIAILAALGATDAAQGLQIATDRAAFRTKVLSATKAESDDAALGTLHAWQRDASAAADLRVQLDADRKARAAEERKGLLAASESLDAAIGSYETRIRPQGERVRELGGAASRDELDEIRPVNATIRRLENSAE